VGILAGRTQRRRAGRRGCVPFLHADTHEALAVQIRAQEALRPRHTTTPVSEDTAIRRPPERSMILES